MKDTIYMLHGMWGGGWIWENFKSFFTEKGYLCFNPNLPFHEFKNNENPHASLGKLSINDYVEFLKKDISKLEKPPIIFGHSMGGILAQILASMGSAKATVLFNPAPPQGISSFSFSALRCMKLVFFKSLFGKPHLIKFNSMKYSAFNKIEKERHSEFYNHLSYDSSRAFLEMAIPNLSKNNIMKIDEKKVKCPMLVIGSKHDKTFPSSIVKKIAQKYPTAEYKEFHDNAHWIIVEKNWRDVADYSEKWISKIK